MAQRKFSAATNERAIEEFGRLLEHQTPADVEQRRRRRSPICELGYSGCTVVLAHEWDTACPHCHRLRVRGEQPT